MPTAGSIQRSLRVARSPPAILSSAHKTKRHGRERPWRLPTPRNATYATNATRSEFSGVRHHVGVDAAARIHRFRDRIVVIAGDDDHVALRVDAADDADMAAAPPAHHRDGANLRAGNPGAVARIAAGKIA